MDPFWRYHQLKSTKFGGHKSLQATLIELAPDPLCLQSDWDTPENTGTQLCLTGHNDPPEMQPTYSFAKPAWI